MKKWRYIVSQFKQPRGFIGHVAGLIMANRTSNKQRTTWTIELLKIEENDNVLEFGCGPGLALSECARKITSGKLVAIDHSPIMLQQARSRLKRLGISNDRVEFREGSLERLYGLPDTIDKIYTINVIQFFDDKAEALSAFYNALKSNGTLAITYMPRNQNAKKDDAANMSKELEAAMTGVGFQNVHTSTLLLNPIPAICVTGHHP